MNIKYTLIYLYFLWDPILHARYLQWCLLPYSVSCKYIYIYSIYSNNGRHLVDTLLLRKSLHFTQLQFTPLHYTCRHFLFSHLNLTQLHFTTLSFGLNPFKFPTAPFHPKSLHFTSLNFTAILDAFRHTSIPFISPRLLLLSYIKLNSRC